MQSDTALQVYSALYDPGLSRRGMPNLYIGQLPNPQLTEPDNAAVAAKPGNEEHAEVLLVQTETVLQAEV